MFSGTPLISPWEHSTTCPLLGVHCIEVYADYWSTPVSTVRVNSVTSLACQTLCDSPYNISIRIWTAFRGVPAVVTVVYIPLRFCNMCTLCIDVITRKFVIIWSYPCHCYWRARHKRWMPHPWSKANFLIWMIFGKFKLSFIIPCQWTMGSSLSIHHQYHMWCCQRQT